MPQLLSQDTRKKLTERLLDNARLPAPIPITKLAGELKTTPEVLYALASRLRRQGRLAPSARQVAGAVGPRLPDNLPGSELQAQASLLQALDTETVLDRLTRMKMLSRLARTGPDPVKIQALKALSDLDTTEDHIGPPPPTTEDEQIERLTMLLLAVGQPIATRALAAAFSPDTQEVLDDPATPKEETSSN